MKGCSSDEQPALSHYNIGSTIKWKWLFFSLPWPELVGFLNWENLLQWCKMTIFMSSEGIFTCLLEQLRTTNHWFCIFFFNPTNEEGGTSRSQSVNWSPPHFPSAVRPGFREQKAIFEWTHKEIFKVYHSKWTDMAVCTSRNTARMTWST